MASNAVLVITKRVSPTVDILKVALSRTSINPTLTHHSAARTPASWSAFDGHLRPFSTVNTAASAQLKELRPRSLNSLAHATRPATLLNGRLSSLQGNSLVSSAALPLSRRAFSTSARILKDKSDDGKNGSGGDGKDSGSGSSSSS
ncbi:hypothetical protein BGZ95_004950, partial [Linnemannia exigua]